MASKKTGSSSATSSFITTTTVDEATYNRYTSNSVGDNSTNTTTTIGAGNAGDYDKYILTTVSKNSVDISSQLGNTNSLQKAGNLGGDTAKTQAASNVSDSSKDNKGSENTSNNTKEINSAQADAAINAGARALEVKYQAKNSRLVNFTYADGSEDEKHRAWLKLEDIDGGKGLTNLKNSLISSYSSVLLPIVKALTDGYTSMIITSFQEALEEKQAVMPTVGDTFALTFSGRNPNLVSISGLLPFDYSKDTDNWYLAYVNAYKFIFRASILAKFHCQLKLIFPDFSTYIIYPVNFSTSMTSEADNLIPFSMSAFVTNFPLAHFDAYRKIENVTVDPSKVGTNAANSIFGKSVANLANNFSNNSAVKGLTTIFKQGTGAIDFKNLTSYGSRTTKK